MNEILLYITIGMGVFYITLCIIEKVLVKKRGNKNGTNVRNDDGASRTDVGNDAGSYSTNN